MERRWKVVGGVVATLLVLSAGAAAQQQLGANSAAVSLPLGDGSDPLSGGFEFIVLPESLEEQDDHEEQDSPEDLQDDDLIGGFIISPDIDDDFDEFKGGIEVDDLPEINDDILFIGGDTFVDDDDIIFTQQEQFSPVNNEFSAAFPDSQLTPGVPLSDTSPQVPQNGEDVTGNSGIFLESTDPSSNTVVGIQLVDAGPQIPVDVAGNGDPGIPIESIDFQDPTDVINGGGDVVGVPLIDAGPQIMINESIVNGETGISIDNAGPQLSQNTDNGEVGIPLIDTESQIPQENGIPFEETEFPLDPQLPQEIIDDNVVGIPLPVQTGSENDVVEFIDTGIPLADTRAQTSDVGNFPNDNLGSGQRNDIGNQEQVVIIQVDQSLDETPVESFADEQLEKDYPLNEEETTEAPLLDTQFDIEERIPMVDPVVTDPPQIAGEIIDVFTGTGVVPIDIGDTDYTLTEEETTEIPDLPDGPPDTDLPLTSDIGMTAPDGIIDANLNNEEIPQVSPTSAAEEVQQVMVELAEADPGQGEETKTGRDMESSMVMTDSDDAGTLQEDDFQIQAHDDGTQLFTMDNEDMAMLPELIAEDAFTGDAFTGEVFDETAPVNEPEISMADLDMFFVADDPQATAAEEAFGKDVDKIPEQLPENQFDIAALPDIEPFVPEDAFGVVINEDESITPDEMPEVDDVLDVVFGDTIINDTPEEIVPDVPEINIPDVPEFDVPDYTEEIIPDVPEEMVPDVPEEIVPFAPEEIVPFAPEEIVPFAQEEIVPFAPEEIVPFAPEEIVPFAPEEIVPVAPEEIVPDVPEDIVPDFPEENVPEEILIINIPEEISEYEQMDDSGFLPEEETIFVHISDDEIPTDGGTAQQESEEPPFLVTDIPDVSEEEEIAFMMADFGDKLQGDGLPESVDVRVPIVNIPQVSAPEDDTDFMMFGLDPVDEPLIPFDDVPALFPDEVSIPVTDPAPAISPDYDDGSEGEMNPVLDIDDILINPAADPPSTDIVQNVDPIIEDEPLGNPELVDDIDIMMMLNFDAATLGGGAPEGDSSPVLPPISDPLPVEDAVIFLEPVEDTPLVDVPIIISDPIPFEKLAPASPPASTDDIGLATSAPTEEFVPPPVQDPIVVAAPVPVSDPVPAPVPIALPTFAPVRTPASVVTFTPAPPPPMSNPASHPSVGNMPPPAMVSQIYGKPKPSSLYTPNRPTTKAPSPYRPTAAPSPYRPTASYTPYRPATSHFHFEEPLREHHKPNHNPMYGTTPPYKPLQHKRPSYTRPTTKAPSYGYTTLKPYRPTTRAPSYGYTTPKTYRPLTRAPSYGYTTPKPYRPLPSQKPTTTGYSRPPITPMTYGPRPAYSSYRPPPTYKPTLSSYKAPSYKPKPTSYKRPQSVYKPPSPSYKPSVYNPPPPSSYKPAPTTPKPYKPVTPETRKPSPAKKPILAPLLIPGEASGIVIPEKPRDRPYNLWNINSRPERRQRLQVPDSVVQLLNAPQPDWVSSLEPQR